MSFSPPYAPRIKTNAGMRIGLLGGSFDPPHAGHVHITKMALRRFDLDQIWWLVSPGNPLKRHPPAEIQRRIDACNEIMRHPKVVVTDIERKLNSRYTIDTISGLQSMYPRSKFLWLMGADNLASFHLWDRWQKIMASIPIAVLPRPNNMASGGLSMAAKAYKFARIEPDDARNIAEKTPPAWCFVSAPMSPLSSTMIREKGLWPK